MAGWRMPGAKTRLNQALATQMLLARRGYPALLHIGVAKGKEGQFQAHAWVESEGKVVIGGAGLGCFTPLAVLEEKGLKDFRAEEALT
jgi:Transglutaminase-like superfamily